MYKKIRNHGIRICLDGAGPDDTLGGLWEDPYFALIDEVNFFNNSERFKDLLNIKNELNNKNDNSKYKFLLRKIIGPKNFSKLVKYFEIIKNGNIKNWDKYNLINKSDDIYPEEDEINHLNHFDQRTYRQFHYYNNPYNLLKGDKLSMAHGVAARSPFMDVNLIKYIFSLSSKAKIGNGFTKRILRDAMKSFLPKSVLNRKDKRGFDSPPNWYGDKLNQYILDNLNSSEFINSNIFD
jgi:asparagine synthase (glutamine-hydrolysing)